MLRQKAGQGITCSHFCRSTYFIDDGDLCAERAGYRFTVWISVQKCSIYKMARCLSLCVILNILDQHRDNSVRNVGSSASNVWSNDNSRSVQQRIIRA